MKHLREEPKRSFKLQTSIVIFVCVIVVISFVAVQIVPVLNKIHDMKIKQYNGTPDQLVTDSAVPTVVDTPDQSIPSENKKSDIILVNSDHPVSSDFEPELVELDNGMYVSPECYANLMFMLSDCSSSGMVPVVCSGYRSFDEQRELFKDKVKELLPEYEYDKKLANEEAQKYVARPGMSEHQLGLAVDIVDEDNQNLETYQEDTPTQQWLMKNSWKYGFILRYPEGTSDKTGVTYEPWHYRYVGKDTAKEIHELGICLEDYLK